jgi:hypothetical protein
VLHARASRWLLRPFLQRFLCLSNENLKQRVNGHEPTLGGVIAGSRGRDELDLLPILSPDRSAVGCQCVAFAAINVCHKAIEPHPTDKNKNPDRMAGAFVKCRDSEC